MNEAQNYQLTRTVLSKPSYLGF